MRYAVLFATLLHVICVAAAQSRPAGDDALPSNYVPSGQVMFKQYCAVCNGVAGKGDGLYALMLTRLAQPSFKTARKSPPDGLSPHSNR